MNITMIFTTAFQLSAVQRFSRDHMAKRESVLEHMGFVDFFAYALAKEAAKEGALIDFSKLMGRCVAHDIDEAILGDIPRTTKYSSDAVRDSLRDTENRVVARLCKLIGVQIFHEWNNSKKGVEGEILKVADIAAVVYKNYCELKLLGNRSFLRVAYETQQVLKNIQLSSLSLTATKDTIVNLERLNNDLLRGINIEEEDKIFSHFSEI